MFGDIGVPELLIILAIVVLLFGVGRVGRLGKDLGTSIKEFRKAVNDDKPEATMTQATTIAPPQQQVQVPMAPVPLPAPDHTAAATNDAPKPPPAVF
ncbi:twin-arginine translocase TatA/TatE family subunit [bacterium]|jgi:sec-independent protein translocase protein TatA|nr:twin-arginine translocase TatA/TatE family subunit [bacterium]